MVSLESCSKQKARAMGRATLAFIQFNSPTIARMRSSPPLQAIYKHSLPHAKRGGKLVILLSKQGCCG